MEKINQFTTYLAVEKNSSPSTIMEYKSDLLGFKKFIDNKNLLLADKTHIRAFLEYLKNQKKHSPKTIQRKIATLRSFYKFCLREDYIPKNPMDYIQNQKIEKKLPVFLTEQEANKIIQAAFASSHTVRGKRDHAMILLFLSTGLRISELANLSLSDITIYSDKDFTIKVRGKGNKERIIPLMGRAKDALETWIKHKPSSACQKIFINIPGLKQLTNRGIQRTIKKYAEQAGIEKKISPHKLRHTFATNLLRNQADIVSIQELLGHESLNTTRIYMHVTPIDKRRAIMKLGYN